MPNPNIMRKVKRLSGIIAITLGVVFTLFFLLGIWGVINFGQQTAINKLIATLGVLTVAFIVLLGILKMLEERK